MGDVNMNNERRKALQYLRTAKGQVEASIKMIEDDRYCVDISNQILATQSLLKKADLLIIRQHINHCLREAFEQGSGEEKLDEVMELLSKLTK
jgi:DNA-binding FrmR family transcriptional regulator